MMYIKNSTNQCGAALLFALGILSLLLVMGIAFLGNALISQKIAVNNQEASAAKLLARSAVDRAMAHLTMFQLMQVRKNGDYYASDASSVFSRMTTEGFDSESILTTKRDQLYTQENSRLSISRGDEGDAKWYNGSKSLAEWIYVHQNGDITDGQKDLEAEDKQIIGRFAYQVLPQSSNSRISLFAVTAGASRKAGKNFEATALIPQKHRLGVDIDELVIPGKVNQIFSKYWNWKSNELCDPIHEFDNFVNILSGSKAHADYFLESNSTSEAYKRWLEYIFVEGRGRVAREAFFDGANWYPRFNLGEFKNYFDWDSNKRISVYDTANTWYQRFLSTLPKDVDKEKLEIDKIKNSDDVIELLTGGLNLNPNPDLRDPSKMEKYTDGNMFDGQYSNPIGLPFLRKIGNYTQKGGFKKIAHLRKQIAANLNDYCDSDDIPTSDVPATQWLDKVNVESESFKDTYKDDGGEGKLPTYTGNEKTPYINEIALGFQLTDAQFDNGKFTGKVDAEVLAELIKIYESVPEIKNFKLHGFFKHLALSFEVTFNGKATVTFTNDDNTSSSSTVDIVSMNNKSGEDAYDGEVKFDSTQLKDFEIDFSSKVAGDGPYWVKNWQTSAAQQATLSIDFSDQIKARVPGLGSKTVTNIAVNPSSITVKLAKVNFNIPNLVLMYSDSAASAAYGVDFVKFNPPQTDSGHVIPVDKELVTVDSTNALATATEANKCIAYVGVMQAIDPRQNLHAEIRDTTWDKTSDWYITDKPTMTFADAGEWKWNDITTRVARGAVNVNSSPKEPFDGGKEAIHKDFRDVETAVDPAWLGEAAGQHISTAVIRNKPMRSPWELGFIHRGIPFQTINLKKAGGIDGSDTLAEDAHNPGNFKKWGDMENTETGTVYEHGDGGILDQIKMTDLNKSYGKVDFSALRSYPSNWGSDVTLFAPLHKQLLHGLFKNLKKSQAHIFVNKTSEADKAPQFTEGEEQDIEDGDVVDIEGGDVDDLLTVPVTSLRSKIYSKLESIIKGFSNDAEQEAIVGKTINLTEGRGASLPNVFKVVVVAQAVRDLKGSVTRIDSNSGSKTQNAAWGRFDAEISANSNDSVYYDEILGECRMLVTVEKLHYMDGDVPRARLRVRQVEYLD